MKRSLRQRQLVPRTPDQSKPVFSLRRRQTKLDPAQVLGQDLLIRILSLLEVPQLKRCAVVSRDWQQAADAEHLWKPLCERLWTGKVYNPCAALGLPWQEAYRRSLEDSCRVTLTQQELCSFVWTFRFKEQAGFYWLSRDPYWTKAGPMLRRRFLTDGTTIGTPDQAFADILPLPGTHVLRWRFTKSREGKRGQFVKVNHWPSLVISRTPDWGWRMENVWVVYLADVGCTSADVCMEEEEDLEYLPE